MTPHPPLKTPRFEALTLTVLVLTYLFWGLGTWAWQFSVPLSVIVVGWFVAQFSSLQHETLHGHPTPYPVLNEALVFPALTLTVPYQRFRDTHLAHHYDPNLTDPYDDPESNFIDPAVWPRLSGPMQAILTANNTLLGRVTIGPAISMAYWLSSEARLIARGEPGVARAWVFHLLGLVPVLAWLSWVGMPFWAYFLGAYIGHGLLRIRSFLEHRAHETCRARTVIVEDRGPLSYLFLNNNYHAVHHMHPTVAWYDLPALYRARRDHYLRRNDGYVYENYARIFARYFFTAKDPVPHPIWPVKKGDAAEP